MADGSGAHLAQYEDVCREAAEWVTRAFGRVPGTLDHWRLVNLILAIREAPAREANELMAAALEDRAAGMPDASTWGDVRADAEFWAGIATPAEIEAYVAFGLRRIERALFAEGARKRILVALWAAMSEADRRAFLRKVDPKGKFRSAA